MQHSANLKNVARFQLITALTLAVAHFEAGVPGSDQSVTFDWTTPLGEVAAQLTAPVTLFPVQTVAILDDAAGSKVIVPHDAKIGDVIELELVGDTYVVPHNGVPGQSFFTAEEWSARIELSTEIDTPDQSVADAGTQAPVVETPVASTTPAIETSVIVALSTSDIATLATSTVAALTTDAIATLSTDQVVALTTDHVVALSTDQVAALSSDAVTALTTDQVTALSGDQIAALTIVPVQPAV